MLDRPMPCKIGTVPGLVIVKKGTKIVVGKVIDYRKYDGYVWERGLVHQVNDDGYFFLERM